MKVKVFDEIKKVDDEYIYILQFSDNPYKMIYKSKDICRVLEKQNIMNKRIDDFFNRYSNLLQTSDMGFSYIK